MSKQGKHNKQLIPPDPWDIPLPEFNFPVIDWKEIDEIFNKVNWEDLKIDWEKLDEQIEKSFQSIQWEEIEKEIPEINWGSLEIDTGAWDIEQGKIKALEVGAGRKRGETSPPGKKVKGGVKNG